MQFNQHLQGCSISVILAMTTISVGLKKGAGPRVRPAILENVTLPYLRSNKLFPVRWAIAPLLSIVQ